MNKKTVRDIDVKGKKVLVRCDFNVPLDKETGKMTNDLRIVAALPTIKYLLENNAKVMECLSMNEDTYNAALHSIREDFKAFLN